MNSWPLSPLGSICEINPRLSSEEVPHPDTPFSFIPMAAIDERHGQIINGLARPFREVAKGYTTFRDGDVLFAKITPCMENGKAAIAVNMTNGIGCGSTEFYVLRSRGQILPDYLFYYVRQPSFRSLCKAHFSGSAGQQRVPKDFLERVELPLPPLEEQQRIVDILNHAAGIRRLREQAKAKAKEFIPALFLNMFGDPAINPKGWEMRQFGELLNLPLRNGISPSRNGRHPAKVLTLAAITGSAFDEFALKEGSFAEPISGTDTVDATDFLICRGNGNLNLVGRGKFPKHSMPEVAFPDTMIAARVDQRRILPAYLDAVWSTAFIRNMIERQARTTSGTYKVNQRILETVTLPLASMNLQHAFAEQVAGIQATIDQMDRAAAAAEQLQAALMARLFEGA